MTPQLVLLARAVTHPAEAVFILPRLDLARRPVSRVDRLEIELWRDLSPLITRAPGDRVTVRRACPDRWRGALEQALTLPMWFVARAEPTDVLLARWNAGRSDGWELPTGAPARAAVTLDTRRAA